MKKTLYSILFIVLLTISLTACGKTKIVHCDNCGAEIKVSEKDAVTEDWILYCEKCNKELGIDESIIEMLK